MGFGSSSLLSLGFKDLFGLIWKMDWRDFLWLQRGFLVAMGWWFFFLFFFGLLRFDEDELGKIAAPIKDCSKFHSGTERIGVVVFFFSWVAKI
jgi:hypothetical protein